METPASNQQGEGRGEQSEAAERDEERVGTAQSTSRASATTTPDGYTANGSTPHGTPTHYNKRSRKCSACSREPIAEEWAIHDYEGFGNLHLGEHESIPTVAAIARGIVEHGPAFAAWADIADRDIETLERFEDAYLGSWSSLTEYAEQYVDDIGLEDELDRVVPDGLRPYVQIDTEMLGRDIGMDFAVVEDRDGSIHIFDTNV